VFRLHFAAAAAALEIPAHRIHLSHRTIGTCLHVHAAGYTQSTFQTSPCHRGGHGRRIAFPASYILASAHAPGGFESTLRIAPSCLREVGYSYDGIYHQKLSTDYRAHVAMDIYLYLMNIYNYCGT
jgi:hypothetical protein